MTQRMASEIFDLPEPLGPTMAVMSSPNRISVLSGKDLKPCTSKDLRTTCVTSNIYIESAYYTGNPAQLQEIFPEMANSAQFSFGHAEIACISRSCGNPSAHRLKFHNPAKSPPLPPRNPPSEHGTVSPVIQFPDCLTQFVKFLRQSTEMPINSFHKKIDTRYTTFRGDQND